MSNDYDVFSNFATDEKKEQEGVEMSVGEGKFFVVARLGNRKHSRLLSSEWELHKSTLEGTDVDAADDKSNEIMCNVMGQTILLGWKGISYKGKPIKYSLANAVTLLSHKDFRKKITAYADDFNNFKLVQEAATEEK